MTISEADKKKYRNNDMPSQIHRAFRAWENKIKKLLPGATLVYRPTFAGVLHQEVAYIIDLEE